MQEAVLSIPAEGSCPSAAVPLDGAASLSPSPILEAEAPGPLAPNSLASDSWPGGLSAATDHARRYVEAAKAPSTRRAYAADWRDFSEWCAGNLLPSLPAAPETVGIYLADRAQTLRPATLARRLASIAKHHAVAGFPSPASFRHAAVSETLQGIRRVHGVAQRQKLPLLTADLQAMLAALPAGPALLRNRALLLVGFASALRRAELAALTLDDLTWSDDGVAIRVRRSKTDPEGAGRTVALPRGAHTRTCPVRALERWLAVLGPGNENEGGNENGAKHLFPALRRNGTPRAGGMHPASVAEILKAAVAAAGYDPALYGGHSLRAGFATQAARNGADAFSIMAQTGHRSVQTVARYVREATLFAHSSAGKLGL